MRFILICALVVVMAACIPTENGFIMKTADPALGVQFSFPTVEAGLEIDDELSATPSCEMIKGNISSDGRKLYHTADSPNYNQTKIDEAKGEKFFCDVESAEAEGWTKAGG